MKNQKQLTDMLNNTDTTEFNKQPKNVIAAYILLHQMENRELFSEYCSHHQFKSIATKIEPYMSVIGSPAISATSAQRIKTVLLKGVHRNYHTEALLGGAAQAYFDLCLFMGIAGICLETNELDYKTAISAIRTSLDELETGYERVCDLLSSLNLGSDLEDYKTIREGVISFSKIRLLFDKTIKIVDMYNKNKIAYELAYEDIEEVVDQVSKQSEDDLFFSHALTVLRNQDQFTQKELLHVDDLYDVRFTEEQKAYYKANIPAQTPDVSSSRAYFFKGQSSTNRLMDLA